MNSREFTRAEGMYLRLHEPAHHTEGAEELDLAIHLRDRQ
jgi:hypothetical protein